MPKTSAERQRDYRERQAGKRRELARLRALVADLEAELEQARDPRNVTSRCETCGTALACPSCHGGGDWA